MKKAFVLVLMLIAVSMAAEEKVTFVIEGMTCNACVKKVTTTLEKIQGVHKVEVTLKPGTAIVIYDNELTTCESMASAVNSLGYKAKLDNSSISQNTLGDKPDITKKAATKQTSFNAPQTKPKVGCQPAACKVKGCPAKAKTTALEPQKTEASPELAANHADGHVCPTINECKELKAFHEAMHPMHEALTAKDYDNVRGGYKLLAEKAKAVKAMRCDKSCVTDVKQFDKLRESLLKKVDNLGQAVAKDNDEQLAKAFTEMHDVYVELGKLAK